MSLAGLAVLVRDTDGTPAKPYVQGTEAGRDAA